MHIKSSALLDLFFHADFMNWRCPMVLEQGVAKQMEGPICTLRIADTAPPSAFLELTLSPLGRRLPANMRQSVGAPEQKHQPKEASLT